MTNIKAPEHITNSPTTEFYHALVEAFDHFNSELFDGVLPPCLITLRSSNKIYGYHHSDRFISSDGDLLDELGLNPGFFALRPVEVTLSTLVHEMVHHWQSHFGTPTPSNPHNMEWTKKMEQIGLIPSSTGLPGGKQTGRKVSHFIKPDGLFIKSCKRLMETGYAMSWFDRHASADHDMYDRHAQELEKHAVKVDLSQPPLNDIEIPNQPKQHVNKNGLAVPIYSPTPKKESKRIKLWCRGCGSKVSLTSELHLICGQCRVDFEPLKSLG